MTSALQAHFGLRSPPDTTSIGASFGQTIANSAVIAIIASLLVISAYVALRFQWKFAVPVLIALMHDLLITSGVYALTGREVTTSTVAALLTILGYSLYDTIIVFDRVRENIPRMPRAAFSQIVNRSMSEVLTRSLATTFCTLLPIIALLLIGGATLQDFAFALLIGVASGAYSSIFIASPVLTHWKEREAVYRHRHDRIVADLGHVPAYATTGADVEPGRDRKRRTGRLTTPPSENVSAAEFEEMKRELGLEEQRGRARKTPTATRRKPAAPPARPGPLPRRARPGGRQAGPDAQAGGRRRRRRGDGQRLPARARRGRRGRGGPQLAAQAGAAQEPQPTTREAALMGMLAWVMMGLALWHFTIWLPDHSWGGIVGAFIGALVGRSAVRSADQRLRHPRSPRDLARHRPGGHSRRPDRHGTRVRRGCDASAAASRKQQSRR